MQRPDISPQTRNDWGIVMNLAVGIGVGVAIHKIYHSLSWGR